MTIKGLRGLMFGRFLGNSCQSYHNTLPLLKLSLVMVSRDGAAPPPGRQKGELVTCILFDGKWALIFHHWRQSQDVISGITQIRKTKTFFPTYLLGALRDPIVTPGCLVSISGRRLSTPTIRARGDASKQSSARLQRIGRAHRSLLA